MIIGVPKETRPGEARVALVPAAVTALTKATLEVLVEAGAGAAAGFPDAAYVEKGARLAPRAEVLASAVVILAVRAPTGAASLRRDQVLVALLEPLDEPEAVRELAARGVTAFAMELIPRITRAQSMDALSSMATIAGYKAVLLAASALPRMFPMLMTAAGTVTPARVLVIGAGVAGLMAIATSRRLGAHVEAYDVRPAVKEQVESLGAKFVELPLEAGDAEDRSGYAKALGEDFYRRQRDLMTKIIGHYDAVITTALVPGQRAPVLITREMVAHMHAGAVIVDLAAERGGNCEATRAGETVVERGVQVLGPVNLPATVPYHASQMYAKNVSTFLLHLVKDGALKLDLEDEITRETLVARGGEVVHPRVRALLGLAAAAAAAATPPPGASGASGDGRPAPATKSPAGAGRTS
jgi:NAD(P) transhydrogenase subunit alpha